MRHGPHKVVFRIQVAIWVVTNAVCACRVSIQLTHVAVGVPLPIDALPNVIENLRPCIRIGSER